jgi:precorrin-3B synthase
MATGDGLLVRVRVPDCRLTASVAEALAKAAESCGNGAIDISARANLQIRGVSDATLADLHQRLDGLGLLEPGGAEAEARRNVLGPALAGDDPSAAMDVRPYTAKIGTWLATDQRLRSLPPKFAVVVDDGGALPLDGIEADLRLMALGPDRMAVGIGHADWIAEVPAMTSLEAVTAATLAFLSMLTTASDMPRRMRELDAAKRKAVAEAVASINGSGSLGRLPERRGLIENGQPTALFAGVPLHLGRIAVALGLAYGRFDVSMLRALADMARRYGDDTLRLTPWRAVLIPVVEIARANALRDEAAALGMVTDPDDPRRRIAACVGANGCASALMATHALADRIAPLLPKPFTLHVSGCAKGCAKSGPTDIVLVGGAGGEIGIVRNGRAVDQPTQFLKNPDALVEWFEAGMP